MKRDVSASEATASNGDVAPIGARGHVLIVEPDPLTQWSLKTYLEKWFVVDTTAAAESAERILDTHAVDALIISDELPSSALEILEQRAHTFNARVVIVRTVTDAGAACHPCPQLSCLEKPFELARVAALLGIPDDEIPQRE